MNRRQRIETELAPASTGFRSNAMVAGGFVFTGGHVGAPVSTPEQRIPPAETFEEQIDLALTHMQTLVHAGGGNMQRVIEVSAFVVPFERQATVLERTTAFLGYPPPLYRAEPVHDVALHGMLEMDGTALVDPHLDAAQAAEIIRPFGQIDGMLKSGPFVIINGLTASGATLREQTLNVFGKAERLLHAAGSDLSQLVKLTVFTADYDTYPEFNAATQELFAAFDPPTRSVIVAPNLTAGALVRMNLIALGKPN